MALLDDVKEVIRISGTDTDGEISDLIESAKADLLLSGVTKTDYTDPLLKRAITIYCKTHYGWDNQEADRLQKSYDLLKSHLSLAGDYIAE